MARSESAAARPALVGFGGSMLVALAALGDGAFPVRGHPGSWSLTPVAVPRGVAWAAWVVGFVALAVAWIDLHRRARRRRLTTGVVVAVTALWIVPLLLVPPLGSRDAYSYAAHGALAVQGEDPGRVAPSALGASSPYLVAVDPVWRGVVSAYGPGSTEVAASAVTAASHDVTRTVVGLRLWMVAGVALMGLGVVVLARAHATNAVDALVLAVAGPITIVHLVGGVHNEALMAGAMVAGLALAARWPNPWGAAGGTAVIALGAAVKLPALAAVVYVGWRYNGRPASLAMRVGRTAGLLLVALGVMEALQVAAGQSWGWLSGLSAGSDVTTFLSLSTVIALLVRPLLVPFGVSRTTTFDAVRSWLQALGVALAVVLLARTPRLGLVGLGGALAVLAILGVSVHAWYFAWALPVLAVAWAGTAASLLVWGSILTAATTRPDGGGLTRNVGFYPPVVLALVAAGIATCWILRRRAARSQVVRTSLSAASGST